jgi:selenocysteine-specific elongation factor
VAVNLRGVSRGAVRRGDALLTPGRWLTTATVDVRLSTGSAADLRRHVVLHAGTAAAPTRVRPLGTDTARLSLAQPLPLRIGDRALLRDPGPRRIPAGVTVLAQRATRLAAAVAAYAAANPLEPGMPLETARQVSGMPNARLVNRLLGTGGLTVSEGRVRLAGPTTGLPDAVRSAIAELRAELARRPLAVPEAHRLAELGLGTTQLAAVRAGELLKIADGIYLAPGAEHDAIAQLHGLPSPFTLSQARQVLDTTRRVAVPIMNGNGTVPAEVDGNRTHLTGISDHNSFEDREGHQAPLHLRTEFSASPGLSATGSR